MGAVCFGYERGALLQGLNAYSYAEDNPVAKKDPSGRMAGWDDIIAAGVGGIVGFDAYTIQTALMNQPMTPGGAAQAFTTGAILGEGVDNAPITGGTSIELALAAVRAARAAGNVGGVG